jgi:hypothetical protein
MLSASKELLHIVLFGYHKLYANRCGPEKEKRLNSSRKEYGIINRNKEYG